MNCPFCRETCTEVYNSRSTKSGNQVWRRRRCSSCSKTFTTYEFADLKFIKIAGKLGKPAPYSRARLYADIYRAFDNMRMKAEIIDSVTEVVEVKILNRQKQIIDAAEIAAIVLTTLKNYDTPAFLKYLAAHAELAGNAQLKRELKKY